ncbi:hypothetical protein M9H77_30914 [Catharanthus roseus]|uniref:Uncharacterized protein n=1 Tax=Catharanthus roseus TaxID=4058 RepID=A0ACB9ZYL8_CATRO|nr:hypothetical protein M9H77_30914 [Catharanthus roseus]
MVKTKNAQVGQGQNPEEGGTSRGIGKGKRVPSRTGAFAARASESFILVKEAARFEEWTRNRRKIAPGHRVDLHDMQGMEAIPHLFEIIGWIPLLIVNELYYVDMIYEFYANLHKGRIERVDNVPHQWIVTRIGGRDIAFDDRLLNEILDTPQDGMRFYTKNKKCFYPNLYSERRFEEIFTRGEVLKRHDDRNVNKLDAYGRLLHHMISNIIIPNVGHKSSITNTHAIVMLALHEHRRMNFGYMAIEHMLATPSSSTKCLPYGCFITKILQHFVINLNKRSTFEVSSLHSLKAKDLVDEGKMKEKRPSHSKIKSLDTLKTSKALSMLECNKMDKSESFCLRTGRPIFFYT